MDRNEWIEAYQPERDAQGNLIAYDVVEDIAFIERQDQSQIWTEVWNFDSELPLLVRGCVSDEDGGLRWFICKNPAVGEHEDLIVYLDTEDWE